MSNPDYDQVFNETREYFLTGKGAPLTAGEKIYQEKLVGLSNEALTHLFVLEQHIKLKPMQEMYRESFMGNVNPILCTSIFNLLSSCSEYKNMQHVLFAEVARRYVQSLFI